MDVEFVVSLLGLKAPARPADELRALEALRFHGLEGLAVARDREVGGRLLSSSLRSELEPAYRLQGLATALAVESGERARSVLRSAGISALLFKGAALVRDGTYVDPGARRMDDADLLVRSGEAARAVEALVEAGFAPVTGWDVGRTGWVDAVTLHDLMAPSGSAVAVDVHWRTEYGRLRFGGRAESLLWEGADLEAGLPAPEAQLIVVGEHLLKHLRYKVHLAAYGDIARVAARVRDWDRVEGRLRRSRLARALRGLLRVATDELGAPIPPGLAAGRGRAGRSLSPRRLVGRRRPVEGRLAGLLHRWRLLGSPARVAADVLEAAFPPAGWLRARYGAGGPRARLRYCSDVLRWAAYRARSPASPNQELFEPTARE